MYTRLIGSTRSSIAHVRGGRKEGSEGRRRGSLGSGSQNFGFENRWSVFLCPRFPTSRSALRPSVAPRCPPPPPSGWSTDSPPSRFPAPRDTRTPFLPSTPTSPPARARWRAQGLSRWPLRSWCSPPYSPIPPRWPRLTSRKVTAAMEHTGSGLVVVGAPKRAPVKRARSRTAGPGSASSAHATERPQKTRSANFATSARLWRAAWSQTRPRAGTCSWLACPRPLARG